MGLEFAPLSDLCGTGSRSMPMRDPRMIQRSAIGIGVALVAAALGYVALAADIAKTEKISAAVDSSQYAAFMENEAFDLKDLAEGAEIQRRFFNRITPPGVSLIQPMFPAVAPFDATNFDESFLDDLLGEDKNSVAIYPLSLTLDPATRETLIYNAEGALVATLPAEPISRVWATYADPARVILQLDLLPSEDVEPYLHVEDRIEEAEASIFSKSAKIPKAGGFALKSLEAGQFGFTGIQRTNGSMRITVSNGMDGAEIYSYIVLYTSSLVVATWTNDENEVVTDTNVVWTPVSPWYDGIESGWECRTTNLLFTDGVATWEDSNIPSNALVRFYAAAQPVDMDEDGLNDGAEILLQRTATSEIDTDGDDLLDGQDVTVDDEDSRYELWAAAGIVHVDDDGLRTFRGEIDAGTDPRDSDTDGDGMSDGEDPEPTTPNQEPLVRFRHPQDGQEFLGPAQIELGSDWLYGTETPSQVVYQVVSELDGTTNEIQIAAGGDQTTNWYAPPGDFRLLVYGVDGTGQTGETHRVDVAVVESDSFAALSSAEKQAVLEYGPRAVEGVEELTYSYSAIRTGNMPVATSGSRTVAGFVNATNFTVVPVSNSHLSVDYHDRDLMYADVAVNTPTTNLHATLYGARRWGSRVEVALPPPGAAPRDWAVDTMLVFDQNERGEWVGKVYPSLNNLATNDPHALLHLGWGDERDAFLYRNGSYHRLIAPTNYGGLYDIRLVFGLNNEGLMVGSCFDYDAYSNAWSWIEHYQPIVYRSGQTGTVLAVSTQAMGGAAYAVNDKGVIVGCEISANEVPRAVKWLDGNVAPLGGLSNATESVAFDVSEDGAIAGMQKVSGQWRPFLADAAGNDVFSPAMIAGVDFREFWHVGKFGALGWGGSNAAQRLYWVIPDNDQDGFSDIVEQEIVDANPTDTLTNIADVASSGDYDGDGLTNLQEWEKQTDPLLKDSDGDHISDEPDPWPMTRRDRDGDGLPDDWETYHGLDPLSAIGGNGATGDPDGDGIVNLLEFELGTIPTGPNGPAFRFHREKMGTLQLTINDSKNCPNGTKAQDSRQSISRSIPFVEILDTNLPPIELRFMVSVTGRVERQNSGFDAVSVNGVRAFTGSNEGMGCEMAGKSNSIVVPVQVPPGELVLNYDTGDGLFHVGAFAKVTGIELTQAETNVPRVDVVESEVYGCAGCSNGCSVTLHLTNSYPAGSAAYWHGGPSNALLGTGTSVTVDYSSWPAKSYRIVAVATGNVAYADACVLHVLSVEIDEDGSNTKFGFDQESSPSKPWVCVEKFDSTKIKSTFDPPSAVNGIRFAQDNFDSEKFSFSPSQPTTSPQRITIAGSGSEPIGWTSAEGTLYACVGCETSSCRACEDIGVFVGEDARPATRYFVISDPNDATTIPSPVPSEPNSEISSRWVQAAITPYALASVHTLQIPYDTPSEGGNGNGKLDNKGLELFLVVEEAAKAIGLTNRNAEPNAIWVFFVEGIHYVQASQEQAVGGFYNGNNCFR